MPLYKKLSKERIFLWKISETLSELEQLYAASNGNVAMLENIGSRERKIERIIVYVLLNSMLDEKFQLGYRENGAPFLIDSDRAISISHTKGYVGVAIADTSHVGIDLQRKDQRLLKLDKHFMSFKELEVLDELNLGEKERLNYLLLCWGAKEAAFKYFQPEVEVLTDISVCPFGVSDKKGTIYAFPKGDEARKVPFYYVFSDSCVLVSSLSLEE